jgi:hypothetical protein
MGAFYAGNLGSRLKHALSFEAGDLRDAFHQVLDVERSDGGVGAFICCERRELGTAYQEQNSLLCRGIDQDNAKVRLGEGALASNGRQQFTLDHRQAYFQILKGR